MKSKQAQMTKVQTIAVILALIFSVTAVAHSQQTARGANKIEPLPRDLEIQLALSALPPHLRDNATVYVLSPDMGFEVARKGTNGFHALVARTGDDTFRGSWLFTRYRDDILYPISFDDAGAKAQMQVFFDAAEMQANGSPPAVLQRAWALAGQPGSLCHTSRCPRILRRVCRGNGTSGHQQGI